MTTQPLTAQQQTPGMDDPRVHEYRAALAGVNAGLSAPAGAHERYRRAITPYCEFMAEFTPNQPVARKAMMSTLFEGGLPLGVIAYAYKATEDELEYVKAHPPLHDESVDEQDRLAWLPYRVYLKTPHWQKVRAAALEHAGHRCALCNSSQNLEVHHRTYERRGAERPADVTVLCDDCHKRHHRRLRPT